VNAREGTRVLIIDDSKTIVTVLKKFLRSAGYETLEALDAESGLTQLQSHPPELIFLDIMLPGMNGFAALRAIRRDPRTRDIPVIMMSGNEQAMEQFFGTRIGADDFMKKPFSRHEVFFRIERLLDEHFVPRRADPRPVEPALRVVASG
ncbi:MAG TPA: response regulator, partial [Azonexus sp.]|nr:response regulator [Azonexus sp.]